MHGRSCRPFVLCCPGESRCHPPAGRCLVLPGTRALLVSAGLRLPLLRPLELSRRRNLWSGKTGRRDERGEHRSSPSVAERSSTRRSSGIVSIAMAFSISAHAKRMRFVFRTRTARRAGGTGMTRPNPVGLERRLTLRDLVLFNLVAVIGLPWVATAAKAGPGTLTLWLLAAALFFVPQGLAVIQLSSVFPDEGGIYAWTKRHFGEGHGFVCGWCYWINNVLYYPTLLLAAAVMAPFVVGLGETGVGDNWT